ncbi:MAG: GPP34 family phosphoprotein [Desulfosudis oleivorans]|nr:GPP34 family phosphoprotein [Desulfosudis oleivorans]
MDYTDEQREGLAFASAAYNPSLFKDIPFQARIVPFATGREQVRPVDPDGPVGPQDPGRGRGGRPDGHAQVQAHPRRSLRLVRLPVRDGRAHRPHPVLPAAGPQRRVLRLELRLRRRPSSSPRPTGRPSPSTTGRSTGWARSRALVEIPEVGEGGAPKVLTATVGMLYQDRQGHGRPVHHRQRRRHGRRPQPQVLPDGGRPRPARTAGRTARPDPRRPGTRGSGRLTVSAARTREAADAAALCAAGLVHEEWSKKTGIWNALYELALETLAPGDYDVTFQLGRRRGRRPGRDGPGLPDPVVSGPSAKDGVNDMDKTTHLGRGAASPRPARRERDGADPRRPWAMPYGLAGALLIELAQAGHGPDRGARTLVAAPRGFGAGRDPRRGARGGPVALPRPRSIDHWVAPVRPVGEASRRSSWPGWPARGSSTRAGGAAALESSRRPGIPSWIPGRKPEIRDDVRSGLRGAAVARGVAIAALIGLVHACDLVGVLFEKGERREAKTRAKEISPPTSPSAAPSPAPSRPSGRR